LTVEHRKLYLAFSGELKSQINYHREECAKERANREEHVSRLEQKQDGCLREAKAEYEAVILDLRQTLQRRMDQIENLKEDRSNRDNLLGRYDERLGNLSALYVLSGLMMTLGSFAVSLAGVSDVLPKDWTWSVSIGGSVATLCGFIIAAFCARRANRPLSSLKADSDSSAKVARKGQAMEASEKAISGA
jgi:hypothetical protein